MNKYSSICVEISMVKNKFTPSCPPENLLTFRFQNMSIKNSGAYSINLFYIGNYYCRAISQSVCHCQPIYILSNIWHARWGLHLDCDKHTSLLRHGVIYDC